MRLDPLANLPTPSNRQPSRLSATSLRGFYLLSQGIFPNGLIRATDDQTELVISTETKIVFDTTVKDSPADETGGDADGSMADLTNNRLYSRHAGWYLLTASIPWDIESSGSYRRLRVKKNGSTVVGEDTRDPIPTIRTLNNLSVPLQLDKDDYVELFGTHAALTLDVIADGVGPYLALTWVGL